MKKLVLIDSNALVHRAFHALPPLNNAKGVMTNAVYGFVSILVKMIKEVRPDYIAATFDMAAPTFRHEEFAEYKSQRVKAPDELYAQIPIVKEVLTAMGIPIYEKAGFEADDLIGSLAEVAKKEDDLQVIIMTGDLDTLQLVEDDKVVVFTMKKGMTDTFIYNEKEVKKRYDLEPYQLVDYRGLKGDPSDNIPGVVGVGEKTASALIKEFGGLDNMYVELEKRSGNKKTKKKKGDLSEKLIEKLLTNKDQAYFSRKLSVISRDVPVDFNIEKAEWLNKLDKDKLEKTLKDYALFSLVKRMPEIYTADPAETSPKEEAANLDLFSANDKTFDEEIKSKDEIKSALTELVGKTFSFIVVDNHLVVADAEKYKVCVISLDSISRYDVLRDSLKSLMADKDTKKLTHDLKEQAKSLRRMGIHIEGTIFDSKLAAYLLSSEQKGYDLEKIYYSELERNLENTAKGKVIAIAELRSGMMRRMDVLGLLSVFNDIELPLAPVLGELELVGVKIDRRVIGDLSLAINDEVQKLEKGIYKLAGEEFNINSPQQLGHIIFDVLGLKGKIRKTGGGALSTAAAELEKLADEHPIIEEIIRYREINKLKTTYIDPFPEFINEDTGRLYTTLNQTGTSTGRLSSQEPNLQNIPVRTEMGNKFRQAFIADEGYELLSLDYSQIELRVVAHISKDEKMIETFRNNEDIHTRTAVEIFDVKPEDVKPNMRRDAKTLNFGILYGMGQVGFQRASGVSRDKAKEFIHKYMTEFPGVAKYMERTKMEAHRNGFVRTLFGRRRQLSEINSSMPQVVSQAERMAINAPIQGTAADMIKIAMVNVSKYLHENYEESDIRMLLQVHDELLFEVKKTLTRELEPKIKEMMEGVLKMDVPITVDSKVGPNWADMEPLRSQEIQ
ncbi:MAG: DNA polymerase I [Candidatus Yanofskybacteria bacterium RIFOXYC1_FULL_44_16]|nr:MAG: DNA polymerase I [Candidatus Yanofskybacteria bacterium RIFOXYA1_FULL_44_17]OGN37339.1 MAG: DNA polymerase I [Candidatus Yanofskybacteria bacterium RIFOXYC1_FULL_44_16]